MTKFQATNYKQYQNSNDKKLKRFFNIVIWCLIIVCCLVFGTWCLPAEAALDISEIGVGARPLGMGKAYTGLADDASAVFTNPAGLSRNDNLNLMSMTGTMLNDVNYVVLGAADNTPFGKFGVGFINAGISTIPLTTLTGSGSTTAVAQYGSADYNSSQLIFSYGSKLSRFLKNGMGDNISLGMSLKMFSQGFSGGPTSDAIANPLQDANGSGMDADLGLMFDPNRWMTLGLTLQNFLPESFGGKFSWQKNAVTEGIPLVLKVGGKFEILGLSALRRNEDQKLDLMLDYENSTSQGRPGVFHAGVEYFPMEMLALRGGLDQKVRAGESGVGVDNNLTAGVGICWAGFTFDYAYHQFGDVSENTTHFFSVGYRGVEKARERIKKKSEAEKNSLPTPEIVPKPQLKTFSDVPEAYWLCKPIEYTATVGIIDGYPDGTFRPTGQMTRAELAKMLVKAKGFPVNNGMKMKFRDILSDDPDSPYINLVAEHKYMQGFSDGTFRPDQKVTRAEMAGIMAKFCGLSVKSKVMGSPFPDLYPKHPAAPAVAATKQIGLFEYLNGREFKPETVLTRAEAAEILSKTPTVKQQIKKLISEEK